jgi:hypothetical protein
MDLNPFAREMDGQANEKRIVDVVVYIGGPLECELRLQNNATLMMQAMW